MNLRQTIFEVIEERGKKNQLGSVYDCIMLVSIAISITPLLFINSYPAFNIIESVTVIVFIVDYLLRWSTADIKINRGILSFLIYPLTPMAIIDLMSILPGLNILGSGFKVLRVTRLLKIVRAFKFLRYSEKINIFLRVLKKEKDVLLSVLCLALFYIFITALVMFVAEPHINPETGTATFTSFFDALYWATVTLTTVGYGDLCPVTDIGRCISMLSSLFGVAIIALPSGVITASYLDEIRKHPESDTKTPSNNEDLSR